jgi:N-acylglucosamine 2-epimerase
VNTKELISSWGALYRKTLLQDVMPFWMRYGLDEKDGALNNCLDDDGHLISRDRYLWSQGRALWTFSALYNHVEPRPEWLQVAHSINHWLATHGRDEQGRWMYRLDGDGNVVERDASIYADMFVLNGLGEYYRATKDEDVEKLALVTYENTLARFRRPGSYNTAPYNIPAGLKTHGVSMVCSFFYYNLGKALGREDICQVGYNYARDVLHDFYRPEKDAILEYVTIDGRLVDSPAGRACVPGHAMECMWFLITIFEQTGDADLIRQCCHIIRRHLELAWDEEYGGLRLALDIDGKEPPFWQKPTYKPWWVQIEALVATLYSYLHTGEDWCLAWHQKVQEYAFAHYPVPTGEWTQWLDRRGNPGTTAALPVKDPFHLPRGLIYLMYLCEQRIPAVLAAKP